MKATEPSHAEADLHQLTATEIDCVAGGGLLRDIAKAVAAAAAFYDALKSGPQV